MKKVSKVMVTGSGGFIGGHLVSFLQKKGIAVVPYDLTEGQDLLDTDRLKKSLDGVDAVIHLAAYGDVYRAAEDPAGAAVAGVAATANLVKASNECGVKKIIYASTWEVYGEPKYQPLDEDHPCLPDHPYSISKYGGELMVRSKLNKVPWIILRLASTWGLHMRPHAVIPLFIRKAIGKEEILLQGGGSQVRQFTHIDDINTAFYKALNSSVSGEVFNIVGEETVTIRQIAETINRTIPLKMKVGEKRAGDVPSALVSSVKAKKLLKWQAKERFEARLGEVIGEITAGLNPAG